MRIGIVCAMQEEIDLIKKDLVLGHEEEIGMRKYWTGTLYGRDVVLVFSRWGKVASASTVTTVIEKFHVSSIVFTGVAGAVPADLRVGDIVVADSLLQYDLDVSPLNIFKRFEVPLLGRSYLDVDRQLVEKARTAALRYIEEELNEDIDEETRRKFNINVPRVVVGTIASGDQFIAETKKIRELASEIRDLKCVEMEGGAVAQVCYEHNTPFAVIRVISDNANESAHMDYTSFIQKTASHFTRGIIRRMVKDFPQD